MSEQATPIRDLSTNHIRELLREFTERLGATGERLNCLVVGGAALAVFPERHATTALWPPADPSLVVRDLPTLGVRSNTSMDGLRELLVRGSAEKIEQQNCRERYSVSAISWDDDE